jgi:uroporphyrinogen decarboxylase
MTKRERVERVYRLQPPDRIPFVPAIYEHKARLIGRTPSEVCRDAGLLRAALERELALYDPDMLVVGVDVYNVEAEAIGCTVRYFDDSAAVPAITQPLVAGPDDLNKLRLPDPHSDGRMPLFLDVAGGMVRDYGQHIIIRGALTGPYSLAAELLGPEQLAMAAMEEPELVRKLLVFAAEVTVRFGAALLARGAEVILFDSRAAPPLISPRLFRDLVLPVYRDQVIPQLKAAGARYLPLIIGGDTTRILDSLLATGATQLLCDAPADLDAFKRACAAAGVPFRANVDARLIHRGPPEAIRREALRIAGQCRDFPGFLLGCGIVAYDCPPEHVLALREALG